MDTEKSKRARSRQRGQPGNSGQFAEEPSKQASVPVAHDLDLEWVMEAIDGLAADPSENAEGFSGFDEEGYDSEGFNFLRFDREGFDRDGNDFWGFDRQGTNVMGHTRDEEAKASIAKSKIEGIVEDEWLFKDGPDDELVKMLNDPWCEEDEIRDHVWELLSQALGSLMAPVEEETPQPFLPVSHIEHLEIYEDDPNMAVIEVEVGYYQTAPASRRSKWVGVATREMAVNLRSGTVEESRVRQ